MNVNPPNIERESSAPETVSEPYSPVWWQERTLAELRDIITRGFGVGQAYDGAVLETERRAREAMRQAREAAAAARRRKALYRLLALGAVLTVMIGVAAAKRYWG